MDEMVALDLPPTLLTRTMILKNYCQLRSESYELIRKSLVENTNQYDSLIIEKNQKIEEVLQSLKSELN
jgi:rhomboid protease GluP